MSLTLGLAIGSALVQSYGQYKASQAQAEAQRQQSELDFLRAEEILSRNDKNNDLLFESALVQSGTQKAQTAGSGRTVESTRSIVEQTMRKAADQITLNTRAAEWEASMARLGADARAQSAEEISKAGVISSLGTLGFGVGSAIANAPGKNPPDLSGGGNQVSGGSIQTGTVNSLGPKITKGF